jgi:hypothetical protein
MLDQRQLRELITDVLRYLEPEIPYKEAAVELLMLTCAQESKLGTYIQQIKGPALGIFQMEPDTEKDLWNNFILYNKPLTSKMRMLLGHHTSTKLEPLRYNLAYQVAMARVHYFRKSDPLPYVQPMPMSMTFRPRADDESVIRLAEYWKKHYNTHLGKGTVKEAVRNYINYIG